MTNRSVIARFITGSNLPNTAKEPENIGGHHAMVSMASEVLADMNLQKTGTLLAGWMGLSNLFSPQILVVATVIPLALTLVYPAVPTTRAHQISPTGARNPGLPEYIVG